MPITAETVCRQAFVQAVMAKGILKEADAETVYQSLRLDFQVQQDYTAFLSAINRELDFVKFEIRTVSDMFDGTKWVGFVNKIMDTPSRSESTWPSSYSLEQLKFFKAIIEELAQDDTSDDPGRPYISSVKAVNAGLTQSQAASSSQQTARQLSVQAKEDTLRRLAEDKWLDHHPQHDGHYCIGVRTFMELREYLLSLELPERTREAWERVL
mmetsp:Transcript_8706/g.20995  ORF Transcript_8706/g.20995 Transcript_8706/m.20995 type:complete len:212 (-) Transcript_8706:1250-1885(-)